MSTPKNSNKMGNRSDAVKDVMAAVMAKDDSVEKIEKRGRKKIVNAERKNVYAVFSPEMIELLNWLLPRYQIQQQDQGNNDPVDKSLMIETVFREKIEEMFELPEKFKLTSGD